MNKNTTNSHIATKKINPYTKLFLISIVAIISALIISCLIGFFIGKKSQKKIDAEVLTTTVAELNTKYNNMVADYETQLSAETTQIYSEADYIAKLLYGQARWNTPEAQRAVAWVVINRVENSLFPNSVKEVVQQSSQWMGYSDENIIEDDLKEIALDVLTDWHEGTSRPISPDYLYLSWTPTGISIRTTFIEDSTTQYLSYK